MKNPTFLLTCLVLVSLLLASTFLSNPAAALTTTGEEIEECVECHKEVTPRVVSEFLVSPMGKKGVQCATCHGSEHTNFDDWTEAKLPGPEICGTCHGEKLEEFMRGKHALAWKAMMALPMVEKMPKEQVLHGCGSCHKIGVKDPQALLDLGLERPYGMGSTCDQCHTRHKFDASEARKPEACSKCHMGFDHPQWEMWQTSKHGSIYFTHKDEYPFDKKLSEVDISSYPGPTCQTCHMTGGSHTVMTPWGFVALVGFQGRPSGLNIVDDPEWESDKAEVLKALRVLTPEGEVTPLLQAVADLKVVRLTQEEFLSERAKLVKVCSECHSESYVLQYFEKADNVVKDSTSQLAEAIKLTVEAREKGLIPPRAGEPENPYPFLLNFYEEPSGIDRSVWLLFLEYRMRAFQGMFHVNPDYTHWYGWSEIRRTVEDVKEQIKERSETVETSKKASESLSAVESLKKELSSLKDEVSGLAESIRALEGNIPLITLSLIISIIAMVIAVTAFIRKPKA